MRVVRAVGVGVALASTVLGLYGLYHTKPLPLSQQLGEMAPLDRNDDGRISAAEWGEAGRSPAEMAPLDTNKDGFIEPQEARPKSGAKGGH